MAAEWVFALSASLLLYTYIGYPLLIGAIARLRARPTSPEGTNGRATPPCSLILAGHNEEATIGRRVAELAALVADANPESELIVVSDGSDDRTVDRARASAERSGVSHRVIELARRSGKAEAVTRGFLASRHEIVVFADARQRWGADALVRLLENFDDPEIGAVSGDLIIESGSGVLAGVGLYWRFEKWIRRQESRFGSSVGVTGAICAVRRGLFRPIPPGTVLDDVYWPLLVAMNGARVVHDGRAKAFDRLPERTRDEFRRKVRTLAGNYQLLIRLPAVLRPWRNPIWLQFVSHKLLRLVAPWAMLALLASSAAMTHPFYRAALLGQGALYLLGLAGLWTPIGGRWRLASAAGSFLTLNAAAWAAFWVWASGHCESAWGRVHYESPPRDCSFPNLGR
ncbi:glycosyltransferase family 2 protein [Paludisphaera rhizosphaerae]|uniref:glycosyltransferase family 2 protein n=1 Tax=Paludisphaera rhizosphaerae TaxID=2711216 RepID=UPI001F0F2826|nr:glycosyltransferase family 2 protein [Paludisphaera rhizosphaerae]